MAAEPYSIWPTPHHITLTGQTLKKPSEVTIVAGSAIDDATLQRAHQVLTEHGIKYVDSKSVPQSGAILLLGVEGEQDAADRMATKWKLDRGVFAVQKYDRHVLSLRSEGGRWSTLILGENTDAVFCGLASLDQMLDASPRTMKSADIADYADIRDRGIIEGYYGVPYSKEVTEDLFRFMTRYKMNTYMYGAKSDPYHSRYWDQPYPQTITPEQREIGYMTTDMMRSMTEEARRCKVNFIWAIHPGTAFVDAAQPEVLDRIMKKFRTMHELGVRQFGVFVDDCGVPDDTASLNLAARRLTRLQQLVDRTWNYPGAKSQDTVKALNYVPQLYAYSWVKKDQASRFFRSLSATPEKTNIYITGKAVWTVPNTEDPALVKSWLGRDVAWWWNYPCNDNDVTKLFMSDTYTNFSDEAHIDHHARLSPDMRGVKTLILNPMQQGEASKPALFGAADYSWNMARFDNTKAWEASIQAIFRSAYAEAFKSIAANLRYYDEDAPLSTAIRVWRSDMSHPETLLAQLSSIHQSAEALCRLAVSPRESDRLLWNDIHCWVTKLRDMADWTTILVMARSRTHAPLNADNLKGDAAEVVAKVKNIDTDSTYQFKVLTGMGDEIKLIMRQAEPSAKVLMPFLKGLAEGKI